MTSKNEKLVVASLMYFVRMHSWLVARCPDGFDGLDNPNMHSSQPHGLVKESDLD